MDDIAKMIGYCTMGAIIVGLLVLVLSLAVHISTILLATPIGIVGFVIIMAVLIKKIGKRH